MAPGRPATHVDAQAERGDGGGLAKGQQQQKQGGGQLHQVEEVVVREEVGRQRSGALGVGEELVVILAFLKRREPGGRASLEGAAPGVRPGPGRKGGTSAGEGRFRPEVDDDGKSKVLYLHETGRRACGSLKTTRGNQRVKRRGENKETCARVVPSEATCSRSGVSAECKELG